MPATDIQVVTGSDSFILTNPSSRSRRVPKRPGIEKQINIPNPSGKEFRLTITISFEEYRQPGQEAGWSISLARRRRHYQDLSKRSCQLKTQIQKTIISCL
jgi:hypothetical protein